MQSENQFGALLKKLRTQNNMTARQLADLLFVSQPTVTRWETGERLPDIHMLPRLAECLGVEPADLLATLDTEEKAPTVLVVEDESIILRGTLDTLTRVMRKVRLYGARTMDEALQFARTTPVDIAFLDIQLGQASGLKLAEELGRIRPRTNVIFLTAYADYMPDAWRLHASGFLLKPLDEDALRRELTSLRYPLRGLNL
jgi:transcriptional regulator with XRE-family HTH domain